MRSQTPDGSRTVVVGSRAAPTGREENVRTRQRLIFGTLAAAVLLLVSAAAQDQGQVREFTVSGNSFAFSPSSIGVHQNDLVKLPSTAQDMPQSSPIDDYRIVKRAGAGQTVTFEFRADRTGPFTF